MILVQFEKQSYFPNPTRRPADTPMHVSPSRRRSAVRRARIVT